MIFTLLFSLPLAAAATSSPVNTAPTVTISSPAGGASFIEGKTISFSGTATDTEDGDLTSKIEWISSKDGSLGRGGSISAAGLSAGTHKITAKAVDNKKLASRSYVTITVTKATTVVNTAPTVTVVNTAPTVTVANTAPTVTISSPAGGASFIKGAAISFSGTASDAQDGVLTSNIAWTSSINGALGDGSSISTTVLTAGTHTITAKATDSGSLAGLAEVSIIVSEQIVIPNPTYYNAANYGAIGSDTLDDSAAIQKAINYVNSIGGGTVYIPDGTYMINTNTPVKPKSNVKLKLADSTVLKAIPTASGSYNIVMFYGVSNAEITGGNIVGDRVGHLGTTGEWGYGIRVSGSSNIRIADIDVSDCWGDGIIVGGSTPSQNVTIEDFVSDNNRRQGISVISAKGLTIRNGTLSNTNGTDPQAGIDFEPDLTTSLIQDVLVENVQVINNDGWGIDWWFYHMVCSVENVTIAVNNCTVTGNGTGQIRYGSGFTSANSNYKYLDITVNGVQIGSGGV
jgi:hypothetical protein